MSESTVSILEIENVTPEVKRFVTDRPDGYQFRPGQATEVAIAKDGWRDEERPFTFTSLPNDAKLEFTIKIYPERDGVTDRLGDLKEGDELILGDAWGAIEYMGTGTFIAGGAGITPFISILRELEKEEKLKGNRLIFSNDRESDVILAGELRRLLGDDAKFVITDEESERYFSGRVDEDYLKKQISDFGQYFYVCGPPAMVDDVTDALKKLGADESKIVTEEA